MKTAGEPTSAFQHESSLGTVAHPVPLQYLRIALPQSTLTPQQLTELAGMIRRFSPRYGLRLRSATLLEIAMFYSHPPQLRESIFRPQDIPAGTHDHEWPVAGRSALRVHVPGAHLRVRQLRVLAALMYSEGLRTVRIADSETLVVESVGRGREAVLRLGLHEAGLISV